MYHLSSTVSQLFEPQVQKNRRFHIPQPTFLFPLETPLWLSCNMLHRWKENSMLKNCLAACTIYLQQFPSYLNRKCKNCRFHVPQPTFLFPLETPLRLSLSLYVAWMERQFNACQAPRSMYLSIYNSFRVIRCLSQCVSPKIAIFTTFLFPLGTPLRQSR